ncbi:MAG: hypothetical protein KC621_00725, partial [Myxococcales bacterium]|nr:hypothetical protein [Myxococcales bacterium]
FRAGETTARCLHLHFEPEPEGDAELVLELVLGGVFEALRAIGRQRQRGLLLATPTLREAEGGLEVGLAVFAAEADGGQHEPGEGPLAKSFLRRFATTVARAQLPPFPSREVVARDALGGMLLDIALVDGDPICMALAPEGMLDAEAIAALEGFERVERWHTDAPPEVVRLTEHGVAFEIETAEFQKTGHFLDMRPHRRWVAERAAGILGWKKHEILLAGTHTHLGPAGIYGNRNYDKKTSRKAVPLSGGSFDEGAAERAAQAVAAAIREALGKRLDTRLSVGHAQAWHEGKSPLWNRSPSALRCQRIPNVDPDWKPDPDDIASTSPPSSPGRDKALATWIHGVECPLPTNATPAVFAGSSDPDDATADLADVSDADLANIDARGVHHCPFCAGQQPGGVEKQGDRALAWSRVQVLVAEGVGAFALVPGTPTVLGYTFGLFSSDVIGVTTRVAEERLKMKVAVTTNILGDVNVLSPFATVDRHLRARFDGVRAVMGLALQAGEALGETIERAVKASTALDNPSLEVGLRHPRVEGATVGTLKLADSARFGPDTQRGGPLGPGWKAQKAHGPTKQFHRTDPQSPKRPWVLGAMPHAPTTMRLHSVRVKAAGKSVSLFGAPVELGTALGRELTDALGQSDVHEVLLTGPAGGYLSYADTPMVYRAQAYEGAGIPYGRRTADWLAQELAVVATKQGTDKSPSFDLKEGKPDAALPKGAPIPGDLPAKALTDDDPSGMTVETRDGRTWIHGWWTPAQRHGKAGPAPGDGAWLELSWPNGTVDDRSEVLVCRLGAKKHSRWFFLAAVEPLADHTQVTATWKGPSDLRPTVAIPVVGAGGSATARGPARARLRGVSRAAPLTASAGGVAGVVAVDGTTGSGLGVVLAKGVLTTALLAEGAQQVAGANAANRTPHPSWSRWSGRADLGLLGPAPANTPAVTLGTIDDLLGVAQVQVGTASEHWTADIVFLAHGPADERDEADRWGVFAASEFVIRRPPGPLTPGAPVFVSGRLVGIVSRATSEHGLATGTHAVVQRLDAWSSFLT